MELAASRAASHAASRAASRAKLWSIVKKVYLALKKNERRKVAQSQAMWEASSRVQRLKLAEAETLRYALTKANRHTTTTVREKANEIGVGGVLMHITAICVEQAKKLKAAEINIVSASALVVDFVQATFPTVWDTALFRILGQEHHSMSRRLVQAVCKRVFDDSNFIRKTRENSIENLAVVMLWKDYKEIGKRICDVFGVTSDHALRKKICKIVKRVQKKVAGQCVTLNPYQKELAAGLRSTAVDAPHWLENGMAIRQDFFRSVHAREGSKERVPPSRPELYTFVTERARAMGVKSKSDLEICEHRVESIRVEMRAMHAKSCTDADKQKKTQVAARPARGKMCDCTQTPLRGAHAPLCPECGMVGSPLHAGTPIEGVDNESGVDSRSSASAHLDIAGGSRTTIGGGGEFARLHNKFCVKRRQDKGVPAAATDSLLDRQCDAADSIFSDLVEMYRAHYSVALAAAAIFRTFRGRRQDGELIAIRNRTILDIMTAAFLNAYEKEKKPVLEVCGPHFMLGTTRLSPYADVGDLVYASRRAYKIGKTKDGVVAIPVNFVHLSIHFRPVTNSTVVSCGSAIFVRVVPRCGRNFTQSLQTRVGQNSAEIALPATCTGYTVSVCKTVVVNAKRRVGVLRRWEVGPTLPLEIQWDSPSTGSFNILVDQQSRAVRKHVGCGASFYEKHEKYQHICT